ncbi:MAG TPA: dCTP deaminase [Methanoregulaceae archaeon]|nr:MAG: dCTP deaminase [Methanolinea sp.]HON81598.1 dCTP deaminase [Methanoregulaceae archaeon]HPD10405.1 dCTP deaminase [Methanoregulaceae archaeon]HRT15347.1 dCTP deaminase [Methanoregulaceae archaeon]HRU30997.1 dCTP deaminase [Methanoregulaceae archaeon]
MILSSQEIEKRLGGRTRGGSLVIRPFSAECLQPASYDLRIAEDIVLPRCICTLAHSRELVGLPADLAATLRTRSSYGRRGVLVTAGYVDPGFRGQLTLGLVNMGPEPIEIHAGDRVVQMIIHQVSGGGRAYEGKYQDSTGAVGAR